MIVPASVCENKIVSFQKVYSAVLNVPCCIPNKARVIVGMKNIPQLHSHEELHAS
jgi:hypothetical protein